MTGQAARLAWYRFRGTFRRRWGGYLGLVVLIGLTAGVAMGSEVAARRTDSSYLGFLAGTNPSDLVVQPFTTPSYAPGFVRQLARLPHVTAAAVAVPLAGAMPAVLAGGLAAGALAGLGLILGASVRRRRRDFALLKTLGFTRARLAGAVAWQSSAIAVGGLLAGLPAGIALGRWLLLAFARPLSAVPDPVVPATSIALAAAASLILANLVAALPGRRAARTPAGLLLRAE